MKIKMAQYIDHTLLRPDATKDEIKQLINDATTYNFKAVCINPTHVAYAKQLLANSKVKLCTVIGFPLGASTTTSKVFECSDALKNGADEIDMVLNIGALKQGLSDQIINEIAQIKSVCADKVLKVIIETCLLNISEKKLACQIIADAGADYIKTSTGFSDAGALLADIILFKQELGTRVKIKASGGIKNAQMAEAFIHAGADRLGTSSGIKILKYYQSVNS